MKKNSLSKRLLSLLLCLALFLSLGFSAYAEGPGENETQDEGERTATEEPEISPVEDAPMADYAVFVYLVDDTTGAFPRHGAVNLMGDYQAFPYEEYRYMVARGDTLTVSAVPDEGYALDTETFRATYRSSSTSSVDRDLPLDETNAFTVPDRGVYSITIHVTFASIYDGYGIFVNVLDLMGTGNTVTADRDRAEEGDLITLTVHMNEGTRFAVPGLEVYKDGDSSTHVDLTQVDDDTYTFIMPAFDVKVFAQFELIEPDVYTISFPDYSPVLRTMIYRNGEFQQGIIWDVDTQAPNGTGWANPGDTIKLDIYSGGAYTVTGMVLHYTLDGEPVEETPVLTPDINGISAIHTSFVMPAADVSVELILTPFYRVYLGCNWLGDARLSAREAFAGQEITLTAVITDPRYDVLTWTSVIFGSQEIVPYTVEKIDDQTYVLKIIMPANAVTLGVEFSMEPVSYLSRNWNGSAIVEKQEICNLYNKVTESSAGYYTLTDEDYEGWWILNRSVTLGSNTTLKIQGDVKLILCDGMTLHAGDGIYIADGSTLTIYGQAEDSGKIYAHPPGGAGIGGMENAIGGNLIVHGGIIDAKGSTNAAGIGGGNENSGIRSVTINGGFVNAEGGSSGAGIGKGQQNNVWEIVTINGGVVNATGGLYAAGIGGGEDRGNGTVIINGGTVTAKGRENGAGIGGGEEGSQDHPVIINGGTVTAEGGTNAAGIGGGGTGWFGDGGHGGEVTITGGTVTVDAGEYGAGIGGGAARDLFCDSGSGGTVTITGGEILIRVPAGSGAGIGGAAGPENYGYAGNGGTVEISGGKLTIRTSATRSAGIGGGGCDYSSGRSGSVSISGGEISITVANGYLDDEYVESQGAGIGGASERSQGGEVIITGGVVMIENYGYGAGIGGGGSEKKPSTAGNGGTVYINNAFVAASSYAGAGIGGGGSLKGGGGGGNGGDVTIDGGSVYALSQNKGAGIGGGNDGNGGTLTVNGGYVMAGGGYLDYNYIREHGLWSENVVTADPMEQGWMDLAYNLIMAWITTGEYAGAGIGGGDDGNGGKVVINGGTVIAMSGMNSARAFGHGDGGGSDGSVSIYDSAKVTYGRVSGGEPSILGIALRGERVSTCKGYAYARVEPCDHPNKECVPKNEHEHTVSCPNCGLSGQTEPHNFDESGKICVDCGYERVIVTLLPGEGSGNAIKAYVTKGEQYTLPECSFTGPNGRSFSGWRGSVNGGEEATYPAGGSFKLTQDLTLTAQWSDPYRLWVNGVQVTSENQSDVLGGETVVYDPETCTLSLNGPSFSDTHEGALIYADDLDLTVTGSGVVSMDEAFDTGVRVVSGSLTIGGNISVAGAGTNGLDADEDVIFQSGVIAAQGGSFGIRAGRNIYVRRDIDRVTADGSRALSYQEIDVDPGVTVVERTSANRLPPEDEWDLEIANHVVFDQGVVVSFVLNGGEMEGETGTVQHNIAEGMTVAEPDPEPKRQGYTFAGWYTDEGLTLEFDFTTELDEDLSLYAKWTRAYPVEIQWEKGDELEQEPESVRVVLQRGRNGEWTTVAELTITAEDEWKGSLEYVPGPDALDSDEFRIREIDGSTGLPVFDPDDDPLASDKPTAIFTVGGEQKGYLVSYKQIEDATWIINSSTKRYSVELSWDIDLGDQDRPDEIEVVLQKQEGKFSWKAVQVITLDPTNGWSGEFDTVPMGYVNDTETFVFYEYRVRELRPKTEEEQDEEYETEEERLEAADERVVHNTFDLDKPFITNLLMTADPENLWTFDYTVKWLTAQATKITIPPPTFTAEIDTYTDTFGKEIEEHESKYFVAYDHNSTSHHMKITNTAVLDIDIRKIWVGFEDDELPESVYLMLMSKVDDDYAEQLGLDGINIYTPVATVVYGSQLNINTIPGVEDGISSGIKALLGDGFMGTAAAGILSAVLTYYTNTGIAIVEAKGDGNNPLSNWRVTMMVKKYGSYGVPMEFAGAELLTGLMEMAIDAIIKQLGIPKISCPVMYHPLYKCWSIKGYAIPFLHDYSYTCNVINVKFDGDESEIKQISGTKTWVGDTEDQRPEEILIHVYAKGEDGSRTEITGSPVTCTKEENWTWSLQIPLNDIAVVTEDGENSSVTYKEIEIEEEIPDGYEASYDGYDITNTYTGTKTVSGHKSWEDDDDADGLRPESITIRLLADGEDVDSKVVTEDDDWKWTFSDLPLAKDGREIEYTIEEDPVEGYESEVDDYNVTNSHLPNDDDEETIRISGYKVWNDAENADGLRPSSITIRLYADGKEVVSRTVTAASGWTWSFQDLPKNRASGGEIVYSITEDPVAGYETEIDGFNATNTLIPVEKVEVVGSKTWDDDDDAASERPESITVRLLADGEEIDRRTVTAAEDWAWSFTDLPKFRENGETEIVYSIKEDRVEGYETEIDGFNLTNTWIPEEERIKVAGSKTWDDLNDADGMRPESITIRLYADGEEVASKTVTALDDWNWRFEDLPKNKADGSEIVYSITEDPVEGYITEIHGYDVTNIIVSRVYGYNVNLKGRIGLNVYLFIPQRVLQDNGLYVTLDGKSFPVASAKTRVVDGLTLYQFSVDKAAKEMNDPVTVRLYGNGGLETLFWRDVDVTETGWSYCIQTYIDRTRETSSDPLLLAVVNAMSDFGSLAQTYFHYNEANCAPVEGNPESVTLEDLEPYQAKFTQGKQTGVTYAGSSLVLRSGTVIRHYFTVDEGEVTDYTFKIGSKKVTPVETADGWMIEIPDVYARYLDNMYTVMVTGSEGRVLTLKYSALSYAYKVVQNNEDADLIALVKAMYLYNRAAEAYFSSMEG